MMYANHAFRQTLKTGHPEGMFSHKIIRDEVNIIFLAFFPKLASIGQLDTLLAKTYLMLIKFKSLFLFQDIHSQNEVLECLEEHQEELSQQCQKQIYRLAELSSDDYHLDRPLFYACKDDRERFCEQVPSGEGRVYKCLKKHKDEETMSDEVRIDCSDLLTALTLMLCLYVLIQLINVFLHVHSPIMYDTL